MSNVPGVTAKHVVITPECQKRPRLDILRETLNEVQEGVEDLLDGWQPEAGATIRVVVNVEKPDRD